MPETILLIHIAGGGLAIVAGFAALYAAKGEGLHLRSGSVFVYSMLAMAGSGAGIAAVKAQPSNVVAGLLALYLVVTGLTTVRPPTAAGRRLNAGAMLVALAVGVAGLALGSRALVFGDGTVDGAPAAAFVVFGVIALLGGASDLRLLRSGELRGVPRLRRHLWRMCFALFVASGSFFLGQADEFPEPLRIFPLLLVPALLPLAAMAYWLVRVRTRSRSLHPRTEALMRTLATLLAITLLAPAAAAAQDSRPSAAAASNPRAAFEAFMARAMGAMLLRSAEVMPEEEYGFRPTDAVRTFGQLIGHLADAQYLFCAPVLGEENPRPRVERTRTAKAELIAALQEANAYCDRAFEGMTDEAGAQTVRFRGSPMQKLAVLNVRQLHNALHYGNLVTYLRMKDIVPPSSDPSFRIPGT